MRERGRGKTAVATILALLASLAATAATPQVPPTGEPLAVEASAIVPLDNESSVSIQGFRGQLTLAICAERELRVISRLPGQDGAELPVGIWTDGSKLTVAPAPGAAGGERILHVEVPKTLAVRLDAADGDVAILETGGRIELHGTNLRVTVSASDGTFEADLQGGKLNIMESNEATLRLKGVALQVQGMKGNLGVTAAAGSIALAKLAGPADIVSEDARVVVNGATGSVHLKATQGDATVTGLRAGGEIEMSGGTLKLTDGRGDISVTSDAPVTFEAMNASLHFDMFGGSLTGRGNQGILEVRTRNTEVKVETIEQGMRLQGDGVKAKISDVGGELYVETSISDIVIDQAGTLVVKLDRGTLTARRVVAAVLAEVTGGDVHILDGTGPVTLDQDGGDAEVSWASMSGDRNSKLTNKSGNITVHLPLAGPCRVEAKSTYGHIDSDVGSIKVTDDRSAAQGSVQGGNRPVISVTANGDIHLLGGSGSHDEN